MKTACARALMPDYLRVIALFGIVIVNVQFIAFPTLNSITDPASWTFTDAVVLFLVNGLEDQKSNPNLHQPRNSPVSKEV